MLRVQGGRPGCARIRREDRSAPYRGEAMSSDIRITALVQGTSSYSGKEGDELAVCEMDGRTLRLTKAELWKFVKMRFQAEKAEAPRPVHGRIGNGQQEA